jgi:hypothetical protein
MVVELKPYRTFSIGDHINPLVDIQTPLDPSVRRAEKLKSTSG